LEQGVAPFFMSIPHRNPTISCRNHYFFSSFAETLII
jgi:hypothetical protein